MLTSNSWVLGSIHKNTRYRYLEAGSECRSWREEKSEGRATCSESTADGEVEGREGPWIRKKKVEEVEDDEGVVEMECWRQMQLEQLGQQTAGEVDEVEQVAVTASERARWQAEWFVDAQWRENESTGCEWKHR